MTNRICETDLSLIEKKAIKLSFCWIGKKLVCSLKKKWPGDGIRDTYDTQNVGFVGSSPTRATSCLLRLALGGRHPDALS